MSEVLLDLFAQAVSNQSKGNIPLAMDQVTSVLLEWPTFPAGWNTRGTMLKSAGHPFDAILNYNRALELDPASSDLWNNRGSALYDLGQIEKSIVDFQKSIEFSPQQPVPWSNIGAALCRLGRIEEAVEAYRSCIRAKPDYVDGHVGLAIALLKLGHFEEGWEEFEWRWKGVQLRPRNFLLPVWDGKAAKSPDDGLLIYGEQGFGDDIQFMRYAPLAKSLGWHGKVYLEVRYPVVRLAQRLTGIDGILSLGDKLPGNLAGIDGVLALGEKPPSNIVTVAPLMSMPRLLWPRTSAIPGKCPYLRIDPDLVKYWGEKIEPLPDGLKVGLCWAGMRRDNDAGSVAIDSRRSMHLADFAPLGMPGISWVSLQMGLPAEEIKTDRPKSISPIGEWACDIYDFYDTAALIANLDLVITVDTSVAHVAGAIGKPVWLLSRFDGCWRWLMDRTDSPWYPTMSIYNQKKPGDWVEVVERVKKDLDAVLNRRILGRLRPTLVASA